MPTQRKLAAIVFTDIAGYTKQISHDELKGLDRRRRVEQLVKSSTVTHTGRVVKTIGDGFMLEFNSSVEAVTCALEIQKGMLSLNLELASVEPVRVRIGIHVGDVVEEDNDLYGNAVNIAQRVQTMAAPGGICITRDVYTQIRPILNLQCDIVTAQPEKPMHEHMEVFQVTGETAVAVHSDKYTSEKLFSSRRIVLRLAFAGSFILGWYISWSLWNVGNMALAAGPILMGCLSYFWARRYTSGVPEISEAWRTRTQKQRIVYSTLSIFCFAIAYFSAMDINCSVWDWLGWNHSSPSLTDRFEGREHQLIRQLSAFQNQIPKVELVEDTSGFFFDHSKKEILYNVFRRLADCMLWFWFASMFTLVPNNNLKSLLRLEPQRVRIVVFFIMAVIALSYIHAAAFSGGIGRYMSLLYAIPDRQVHGDFDIEKTSESLEQWAKTNQYKIHGRNKFSIATVPDGNIIANYQIFRIWKREEYLRWKMAGFKPSRPSPFITVVCLSSLNSHETLVTISTGKIMRGKRTISEWNHDIDSLESMFKNFR